MFNSLQSRLFMSYLALVVLTLCVIAGALILLLLNNPLATAQSYRRLADIVRASLPYLAGSPAAQVDARLAEIAQNNEVRVIRLTADSRVEYDSAGDFAPGDPLDVRPNRDANNVPALQRGTFQDSHGQEWLTVTVTRPAISVIVADPRPQNRVAAALGESLTSPLLEAAAIGIVLSVVFAILISNWVSRPLEQTAAAVRGIAAGDYGRQAPEQGPSEARDLARSFNQMSRQVQQTWQMQRDFLANVSHELKTPLTSIQGFAQAILDGATPRPAEAAQVIFDEAARMRRLVEELLDLARIESGQTVLRRELVQLSDLLSSVVESFTPRAAQQSVTLSYEPASYPPVLGDSDRLAQVFTNLIDNALSHTPAGGQVSVRGETLGQGVQITVQDTGKGIPPGNLSRIFERFYQSDKSRVRPSGSKGTGLGLTISKEIVQALGGVIRAENNQGAGATFMVWLPLPQPSDQTATRRKY